MQEFKITFFIFFTQLSQNRSIRDGNHLKDLNFCDHKDASHQKTAKILWKRFTNLPSPNNAWISTFFTSIEVQLNSGCHRRLRFFTFFKF